MNVPFDRYLSIINSSYFAPNAIILSIMQTLSLFLNIGEQLAEQQKWNKTNPNYDSF